MNRPPLEELMKRIDEIQKTDLRASTIESIKEKLRLLFTGFIGSASHFERGTILHRGVPYKEKPKKLSELSYPPIEKAKMNRANRQGEQCFYCSGNRQVPFYELGLQPGDRIALSYWVTTETLLFNSIGYTEENFKNLNANRDHKWYEEVEPQEMLNEENKLVQNFLAKAFSQQIPNDKEELKKLTIAIAEKHHSENIQENDKNYAQFAGLFYPTIKMNANADNFAIKKSVVDHGSLIFKEVEYIEIKSVAGAKYNVDVLDWANSISDDGLIEWKGRVPQWTFYDDEHYYITIEDGRQVARNLDGEIIEPH